MVKMVRVNKLNVFYKHIDEKVIQILGVLTDKEVELTNTNPSLLDEEQSIRINKILKELEKENGNMD